jgi:DNA-binding NtrC family response regulator
VTPTLDILVVGEPSADRAEIVRVLSGAAHRVTTIDTPVAAQAKLSRRSVLMVDLAGGAEALRLIRTVTTHRLLVPIVAVVDRRLPDASSEALRLGVTDMIPRPIREADVVAAVANAREFARLASAPAEPAPTAPEDGVFGHSPAMRSVMEMLRRIGPSRCGVLIVGERGTGREMVARAVHAHGRGERPFVTFDCAHRAAAGDGERADIGGFERDLFEAVARAAFRPAGETVSQPPGGSSRRAGSPKAPAAARPSAAAGDSTIYLKNLDDLPLAVQSTLERLLIERDAAALPGERLPRLLASAAPRIGDAVDRGQFRRELFERIAVVRIDLPTLRQRPQDIPLLATHFLKDACRQNGAAAKTFTRAALTLLAALPWDGNARELGALTERLAVLVPRGVVLLEDLVEHLRFDRVEARGGPRGSLREARERFERDFVASVLQHHRGRMGAAARELGIERTNLYRKIKQLKIRWGPPAGREAGGVQES